MEAEMIEGILGDIVSPLRMAAKVDLLSQLLKIYYHFFK